MEKIIIIVLIIFIIIVLSRIRIVIIKELKKEPIVKLYIFPKLSLNISLDKFIKKYKESRIEEILDLLTEDIKSLYSYRNLIYDIVKVSRIRKINININYNYISYSNDYVYIFLWNLVSIIKMFFDKNTRQIDDEYYYVDICQKENDFYLYIDMIFPIIFLILTGIKNIKIIIKGIIKNGTSNKRTFKTVSRKHH